MKKNKKDRFSRHLDSSILKMELFIFIIFFLCTSTLFAQIQVKESSGNSTSIKTTIIFQPFKEENDAPIYQVLDQSSLMASGYAGTISGTGQTIKLLCTAPAELLVNGGVYTFQCSDALAFNGRFNINAKGGTQVWEVKSGWGNWSTMAIYLGTVFAVTGPAILIASAASDQITTGAMLWGGALTLVGAVELPLAIKNKPSAKLIESY